MKNDFRGFSLFNDIEDAALRTRNRGVVLANIAEDGTNKEKRITPKSAALILGYMQEIPEAERFGVTEQFKESMNQRGYALV